MRMRKPRDRVVPVEPGPGEAPRVLKVGRIGQASDRREFLKLALSGAAAVAGTAGLGGCSPESNRHSEKRTDHNRECNLVVSKSHDSESRLSRSLREDSAEPLHVAGYAPPRLKQALAEVGVFVSPRPSDPLRHR
jgi:hypothetical protein